MGYRRESERMREMGGTARARGEGDGKKGEKKRMMMKLGRRAERKDEGDVKKGEKKTMLMKKRGSRAKGW